MWLVGCVVAHYGEDDLAGGQVLQPFLRRKQLAVGREDRFHAHQVVLRDTGRAQRKLKGVKLLAMLSATLGKKNSLRLRPHLSVVSWNRFAKSLTRCARRAP